MKATPTMGTGSGLAFARALSVAAKHGAATKAARYPLQAGPGALILWVGVCMAGIIATSTPPHAAVTQASKAGVRSSLSYIGTVVTRPFDTLSDTTSGVAARLTARNHLCNSVDTAADMEVISTELLSALSISKDRILHLYMVHRLNRLRNGTVLPTGRPGGPSDANADYDWGECGCTPKRDPVADPHAHCYFTPPTRETREQTASVTNGVFPNVSANAEGMFHEPFKSNTHEYAQRAMALTHAHEDGQWGPMDVIVDPSTEDSMVIVKTHMLPLAFSPGGVATDVLCADLNLGWVRQMLLNLDLASTQIAVIDAADDLVLATTYVMPTINSTADTHTPWPSGRTQNSSLNAAVAVARRCGGAAGAWADMAGAAVCSAGTDLVGVERITLVGNLSLVVVIVVDRSVYFADTERVQLVAVLIGVFGFIVAGAGAFAVIHMITVPLRETGGDMQRAARFALEKEDVEGTKISGIREVAALQMSFAAMALQLIEYRPYLPQSLICATDSDVGDVREEGSSMQSVLHGSIASRASGGRRTSQAPSGGGCVTEVIDGRRLAMVLARRRFSVLALNVCRFSDQLAALGPAEIFMIHTEVAGTVVSATLKHNGITESFSGDRFLCSFNASKADQLHRYNVCRAGLAVTGGVKAAYGLEVSAAATTCDGMAGNAGCDGLKKFALLASGVTVCHALERFASRWRVPALLTHQRMNDEIKVAFAIAAGPSLLLPKVSVAPVDVYQVLGERIGVQADEWMYELAEQERSNPCFHWNKFAAAVKNEDWATARAAWAAMGAQTQPCSLTANKNPIQRLMHEAHQQRRYTPYDLSYV